MEDANVTQNDESQQTEAEAKVEGADQSGEESTENEAESSTAQEDSKPVTRKGPGKRIDELTRNWREAERERDYWRNLAAQKQEQAKPEESFKSLEDFNYDEKAYQKYLFDNVGRKAIEDAQREMRKQNEQREVERRNMAYKIKETEFAKDIEDYFEATRNPQLDFSDSMAQAIMESDEGPAIAYHLAKHPSLAAQISQLSPLTAAREIGKLESKLIAEKESLKKKVSSAPQPPSKVDGIAPVVQKDPDKMTMNEWLAMREKQLAKKRK